MRTEKIRAYLTVGGLYVLFLAVPFLFNNCGPRAFYARQAYDSVTKLEADLIAYHGENLKPEICALSAKYSCQHKVFSRNAKDSENVAQFNCVDIGGTRICPSGNVFTYNSSAAASVCKEGCNESYEYEEYFCTYDIATVDGIRPIAFTADSLEESIHGTYAACARVTAQAQGIE